MNAVLLNLNQSIKSASKKMRVVAFFSSLAILCLVYLIAHETSKKDSATGTTLADIEHTPGPAVQPVGYAPGVAETFPPYPHKLLEQPLVSGTGYTPIAVSNEPIWTEHNQRLLNLEASVTALKQETQDLKEQVRQYQVKIEANKAVGPGATDHPPTPAKVAEGVNTNPGIQNRQTTPPIRKASLQHARRTRLKKHRHKANPTPQHYQLNSPIVVEAVNTWGNEKRVVVRDPQSRKLQHLRVGDDLGGWTIEGTQGRDVILHNNRGQALLKIPDKGGSR